ncbi:MAG: hypothetical protein HY706_02075 [Candidatus Hydrogenedentes bacterium]|nr:hypothetical protein [Candidatus Hydrogenedentota bacterium]
MRKSIPVYFVAKVLQAGGLAVVAIGFLQKFPKLMDVRILAGGITVFIGGWLVEKFLLRSK